MPVFEGGSTSQPGEFKDGEDSECEPSIAQGGDESSGQWRAKERPSVSSVPGLRGPAEHLPTFRTSNPCKQHFGGVSGPPGPNLASHRGTGKQRAQSSGLRSRPRCC